MNITVKIGLIFLLAASASAQQWLGVQAGIINYAQGIFYIDGEQLQFPEARFREIPKGKTLCTGDGWVEIQLGPYAFLWMGEEGTLRMEDPSPADTQLLIERGSILVEIYVETKGNKIGIRCGETVVELKEVGLYRIDSGKPQLRVYEGKAAIQRAGIKATVKQGRAADFSGNLKVVRFDTKQTDTLYEHAMGRSYVLTGPIKEVRRQQLESQQRAEQARQQ